MQIGRRVFDTKEHTYIMGILNVTPDSFSDGGKYTAIDKALYRVEEMEKEGVDILDIGGESTRPGHVAVSQEEEIHRVIPVIRAIKSRFDLPLSLDTWKGSVAEAGIEAGADMINDIWGLKADERMARIIAESNVACCLMHNRKEAIYNVFKDELMSDCSLMLNRAWKAGIRKDRIILDPGIGFGKSYQQNLEAIGMLLPLQKLGYPLLLGVSRKSVIGLTLDLPLEERLVGTVAAGVFGMLRGCSFLRVHDVKAHVQAVKMVEAIREQEENEVG